DSSTESREYFELMISELDRANDIITEFLSLARVNPISLERRNLNEVIKRLYPLIHSDGISRDKAIELKLNPVPDLNINVKEISQLILNMVRNGLDAMEDYGVLTIETRTTGKHVVLSIKDQGCGISKEFIAKLGTPFFTTKANGTGLGLAVCYGIAERHNATIEVKSGAEGTVFSISFPVDQANSNQG
ncbi:MAG TPA: ATP-binding protein, partial [Desulfobacteria bacterium]|nr:ATP-binding protein [Desulfobacteria bacterium]